MIKMLAVDMDGTCLNSRSQMTDETLLALRRAAAAGITVVPATGRNLGCIPHRLAAETLHEGNVPGHKTECEKNKGLFRYVITSNGAVVADIRERRVLFRAMMPKEDAVSLLRDCRGIPLGRASHICHRYLMQGKLLTAAGYLFYGRDASGVYCVRDMEKIIRESRFGVEELQFYFLSGDAKRRLRDVLKDYPGLSAAYTGIYAEIYSAEASKGNALAALSRHLGISRSEVACIGDGENDLSMFSAAGIRIAMGNGVRELKERADYITDSNNKNGVAKAIDRYILGKNGKMQPD